MNTLHKAIGGGSIDNFSNFMGDISDQANWLVLLSQNRDSDALTRSNFECALKALGGESSTVNVLRFGHWGCGWYELIVIDPKDTKAVNIAEGIEASLSDYPVVNDEHFFELEYSEKCEYWDNMETKEKIEICKRAGQSIFSARDESPTDRVLDYL